ncbi:hypothetical protein GGR52DRAFT_283820 [Hypoxylon sp. FL1284]|nr:hypothetical protein GGR52DRAFT_283820 [Hypoxylon sp. FL1284]
MESTSSLPFLVQPTTAQAAHEIILVHGFKIPPEKRTKAARCREALESWVLDAAEPMKTQVNVRVFVYDSAHIFHHGHIAFSEVVANLSKRLEATCAEPFSPLSRQRGANSPTASSSTCSPSRAAIFIAHGIGAWVVKSLLGRSTNQIDPTGLIFLDVLDTPPHQTPLDLPAENFLVEYLRKVSTVFKLHGEEVRIIGLRDKLLEVDHAFQRLADTRYGPCTSINEADTGRCTYSMKMWCENVWMSARSTTVSNETCMKKMNKLLPRANRSKRRMSAPKLDKLQLKGKIREAISMDGFNDPVSSPVSSLIPSTTASSYHTCIDDATLPPLRLSGDGELDFRFPESGDKILSSQESSDWVQKRDKGKGASTAS